MEESTRETSTDTRVGREIFRVLLFAPGRSRSVSYLSNYLSEPRDEVAKHCARLHRLGLAEYESDREVCTLVADHVSRARELDGFL